MCEVRFARLSQLPGQMSSKAIRHQLHLRWNSGRASPMAGLCKQRNAKIIRLEI